MRSYFTTQCVHIILSKIISSTSVIEKKKNDHVNKLI